MPSNRKTVKLTVVLSAPRDMPMRDVKRNVKGLINDGVGWNVTADGTLKAAKVFSEAPSKNKGRYGRETGADL